MKALFTFIVLSCTALVSGGALNRIIEGDDISVLDRYVSPGCVVVFDLDDTLIRCQSSLGSSPWFYGSVEEAQRQGMDLEEALDYYSLVNAQVAKHLIFELIDERARNMIRRYQEQGIIVVALTARPADLMTTTLAQLHEMDVDFGASLHVDGPFIFDFHEAFGYQSGILFVSDRCTKEQVLEAFVDQLPHCYPFERVVFVDDKAKYLEPMAEFSKRRGFEFVGLRYSHEDGRKDRVSLDVARQQLTLLHSYLPGTMLEQVEWLPQLTFLKQPLVPDLEEAEDGAWVLFGRVACDELFVNEL